MSSEGSGSAEAVLISSWKATRWEMIHADRSVDLKPDRSASQQIDAWRCAVHAQGSLDFTLHYNLTPGKTYDTGVDGLAMPGTPLMLHIYAFGNRVFLPGGRLRLRRVKLCLQTDRGMSPQIDVYEVTIRFAKHFPVELRQQ